MSDFTPDFDAILGALVSVYGGGGEGTMVRSLAEHLTQKWPDFEEAAILDAGYGTTVEWQVHMNIWNWMPGGSTAEVAAQRVIDAVYFGQLPND